MKNEAGNLTVIHFLHELKINKKVFGWCSWDSVWDVVQLPSENEAKLLPAGLREAQTKVTRTEVTRHKSLKPDFEKMRESSRALPGGVDCPCQTNESTSRFRTQQLRG
jgi:hypothetical protein